MSRDKQIEEMARILCGQVKSCAECSVHKPCLMNNCARILTDKGYRKASDVAEGIFAEIDSMIDLICAMTGLDFIILGKYAKLKKKYIGKDTNVTTKETEDN